MDSNKMLEMAENIVDRQRSLSYLAKELENIVDMNNPDVVAVVRRLQLKASKGVQDSVFQLQAIKDKIKQENE